MDFDRTIFDKRFIFSYTSDVWDKLLPHWTQPLIKKTDHLYPKEIVFIANCCKKTVLSLAFAVATTVMGIFSLLTYPYRCCHYYYQQKHVWTPEKELTTLKQEINVQEIKKIEHEIEKYLKNLDINNSEFNKLSLPDQHKMISQIASSYMRSKKIYGPVVRLWAEHLLERANTHNRKLIFMARDGIPPYKMAKELMKRKEYQEKYPNLVGENKIVLGYFSRKLIANAEKTQENQKLFQEYLTNELGIQAKDSCLFVDIGFEGSMVDPIRKLAEPVIFPNSIPAEETSDGNTNSVSTSTIKDLLQFEFLIAMRLNMASGFLANEHRKLNSVPFAGGHLGVHWLEDSHQGNTQSASYLVRCAQDGRIYPDVLEPNKEQLTESIGTFQQILREFNQQAIMDCVEMTLPKEEIELFLLKKRVTILFDNTLQLIKEFKLPLYMRH